MDIGVAPCNDLDFIKLVLLDDWSASSSDGCTIDDLNFDDGSLWLEMRMGDNRVGCWKIEIRTNISVAIHCNILRKFRRSCWATCAESLVKFLSNSAIKKILIEIPSNRKRAQHGAAWNGFKREAVLSNAIIEDGELADIYVYSRFI